MLQPSRLVAVAPKNSTIRPFEPSVRWRQRYAMSDQPEVSRTALLWAAITTAALVAFLSAPLVVDLEFARTYLIGPRGIFAILWIFLIVGALVIVARAMERKD